MQGSHSVHCTVIQNCQNLSQKPNFYQKFPEFPLYIFFLFEYNCQNLSKKSIFIKISIKISFLHFCFPYLSTIQVCAGIYWSRQNHCTGCTQYTVGQKHQNLSKKSHFPKSPQIFTFNSIFRFQYNSSLCWNLLVAQHKLLQSGPKASGNVPKKETI